MPTMATHDVPDVVPHNTHPWIMCEGACGYSPHTFHRRQRIRSSVFSGMTVCEIFRCDACGHERVYGAMAY